MISLGCGSVEDLRHKLPELRAELDDPAKFRAVYRFAYGFSLEPGIKCLSLDVAISMWHLLFSESRWPLLEDWCAFLEGSDAKTISRDTWNQLLPFIEVRSQGAAGAGAGARRCHHPGQGGGVGYVHEREGGDACSISPSWATRALSSLRPRAVFCLPCTRNVRGALVLLSAPLPSPKPPPSPPPRSRQNVDAGFEDYDDTSSWPHLMDEFVEYMRKKRGGE